MKKFYHILLSFLTLWMAVPVLNSHAQSVLNPNDTIVNYDPNNPPSTPTYAGMFKWVRTPKFSWSIPNYKCYYVSTGYMSGMPFRLLYPKTYQTDPPGTTYPMLVFFHGEGEIGKNIFDNELQLANCAQAIMDSCLKANPSFDGFIMFPQTTTTYWNNYFPAITQAIDYMTANNNLDPNRVIFSGLSMGGGATWQFIKQFPGYAAGATPMCNASMSMANTQTVDSIQDIPIWYTQGGLDTDPYPATATSFVNYLTSNGISVRYTLYPNLGHGVWNQHYLEPDAFTWMAQQNRTNPHVYSNRSLFCIGDTIRDTLGVVQGFPAYQWAKNGTVIPGATSNTIIVTDTGTYSARILMNNGQWSYWSPAPAYITYRAITKAPAIQVAGLMSRVIPAPDASTSVTLTEPAGYATYQWTDGAGRVLANSRTYTTSTPGYYRAVVTVNGGCSTVPSDSFYVAAGNGPNPPSPATDLSGYALSQTSIQLNWSRDLHPSNPETAFEIYRGTSSGGPYVLAGIVPAGTTGFADQSLVPGTMYYYAVRAIDSTAAAPLSTVDSIATLIDKQAPTAPGNLRLIGADSGTLTVNWSPSTDNVGVTNYYIYVNGLRRYATSSANTQFTLTNLIHDSSYVITVKAVDGAGNISAPGNQVVATVGYQGLTYYYYLYSGNWNTLPDYDTLTPAGAGLINNVSLSPATRTTYFSFSFRGNIRISQAGTYTFYTNSDDGSKLYINNTLVVNNDGLHGATQKSGAYTFGQAGVYPFRVDYYQQGGAYTLTASWQASALNIPMSAIPDSVFAEKLPALPGTAPAKPTGVSAQASNYHSVTVAWTSHSSNQKGFEVYRSQDNGNTWLNVVTAPAAMISFTDTTVAPATAYMYKVQAVNQYGSSGFDSITSANTATTPPLPPAPSSPYNLVASPVSGTAVFLSWKDSSASAAGINIYRSDGTNSAYRLLKQLPGGSTNYTDNSLYPNTTYYYKSAATGTGGTSGYSNEVSAVTKGPLTAAIYLNFNASGSDAAGGYWNNLNVTKLDPTYNLPNIGYGDLFGPFKDSVGNQTNVGIKFTSHWENFIGSPQNTGAVTGNNSGIFPDAVLQSIIWCRGDSLNPQTIQVTGLDPNKVYSFTFSGSYYPSPAVSAYQIGTQVDTLQIFNNTSNAVTISNVKPDSNGNVTVSIYGVAGQYLFGILSGMVIKGIFPSANGVPYVPIGLSAIYNAPAVRLNWSSISDNASGFSIYRKVGSNGTYTQIGSVGANITAYNDSSIVPYTNYFYKVSAYNMNGNSPLSDSVQILIPSMGSGMKQTAAIYLNFNASGSDAAGGYWNNLNVTKLDPTYNLPNIGYGDLFGPFKDSVGNQTNVGIKFTSHWENFIGSPQNTGAVTGNNSGIFPDAVLQSIIWCRGDSLNPQTIQVTGLDPNKVYSFTFSGSYYPSPAVSAYQIGTQVDTLQIFNNTSNAVTISNVKPDSNGNVTVSIYGVAGQYLFGILSGMVIKGYSIIPGPLTDVTLTNVKSTAITQVRITWAYASAISDSVKIYRSTSPKGSYTLLNPGSANGNTTSYIDSTVSFNTTYYYYLVAANAYGQSSSSDTAGIFLPPPVALQMQALSNQQVAAGSSDTVMVHLTGSDSTVQFSLQNAPSFAAVQRINDSTAMVILTPGPGGVGVFNNVQVIAALSNKNTATQAFNLSVTDGGIYTRFYLNFTTTNYLVGQPWNNITLSWGSNVIYPLANNLNQPGSASLKVVNSWSGTQSNGANTFNNTGAVPDSVMSNGYYISDTNTRTLVLSGLDQTKRYNLVFFGSSNNGGNTNYTTNYTVNGQTVSLNGIRNTNNTVRINGIQPDTGGNITITVAKAGAAAWGLLNAMIVEAANANTLVAPGNLTATGTTSQVTLNWQDRSTNETGFIILRSGSLNGTYTQAGAVSAGTTTYKDNTVVPDRRYFYEVVATNAGGQSVPSNIAAVTTPAYAMYINFNNAETPAPAPWNNTQRPPQPRDAYGPLTDTRGNNSGIVLNMITNFEGENPVGVNTGNNSGIYPDLVMQSCYYQDNGLDTIFMQVSNLDLTKKYDLTFFGSIAGWGWINTTQFIANGQSVALEASYNSTNTVTLSGLTPGQDGNIMVKIIYTPQSRFAILNAMVIKAYDNYDNNGNLIINPQLYLWNRNGHRLGYGPGVFRDNDRAGSDYKIVKVYPNPFDQYVEVLLNAAREDQLIFSLVRSNGAVSDRQLKAVSEGMNTIRYEPARVVSPGFYVLQVTSATTGKSLYVKLIRR
jgi:predicted esterase